MINQGKILMKVCGMREPSNIIEVAKFSPNFMGFIFYKQSPRYVGLNFSIPADFPEAIKRVGVFVNQEVSVILETAKKYQLDFVQLHGGETVNDCNQIKESGIGVIKVFSVYDSFDFSETLPYQSTVDYFLFDTKGKYYGGNNQIFDWKILLNYNQRIPFLLSGGLNADNVSNLSLLSGTNLAGVDLNSGVETMPGIKDVSKIKAIRDILNLI